jgi:chemotaxis protein CheY-P-specific phosphatase CheC
VIVSSSSHSTKLSSVANTDVHISVPSAEPGTNVRSVDSRVMSAGVAAI